MSVTVIPGLIAGRTSATQPPSGSLTASQQANSRNTPSTRTIVEARSESRVWAMRCVRSISLVVATGRTGKVIYRWSGGR